MQTPNSPLVRPRRFDPTLWIALSLAVLATVAPASAAAQDTCKFDGRAVELSADGTWTYASTEEAKVHDKASKSPGATEKDKPTNKQQSQCSALLKTTHDKMTGRTTTQPKEPILVSKDEKTGLLIAPFIGSSSDTIVFMLRAFGGSNCVDDKASIYVLFDDDSRLELRSNADFNCDNNATVYLGGSFGKTKQLNLLATKKVASIRVVKRKGHVQEDFSAKQATRLQNTLKCLMDAVRDRE
jgi:hypothetical protein